MSGLRRRTFILGGLATVGAISLPAAASARSSIVAAPPTSRAYPFTLGVASGEPAPDSVVLWTRLAPSPTNADGQGGMPNADTVVDWQVSNNERFSSLVASGSVMASFAAAHSVHIVAGGLAPDAEYYYRFRLRGVAGRLPAPVCPVQD
jgi:alkaline phosphatase D